MTTRIASARLDGDALRLIGTTGSGHTVVMDDASGDTGPRPAELLMVAQAGCTAMDVSSILRKKRQPFSRYDVQVIGEQRELRHPHVLEELRVVHRIEGEVGVAEVRRAIELSATRYCTVTANLASGVARIRHEYVVRDPSGAEQHGEVVVTGPHRSPDAAGERVTAGYDPAPTLRA